MSKVAVYGGSFNPIHIGHVMTVAYLLTQGFSNIYIIPCYQHPFGKELADFAHRYNMCECALKPFKNGYDDDTIIVSAAESKLPKPSLTHRTLQYITEEHGEDEDYYLILGSDLMKEFSSWEGVELIKKYAKPYFINRGGYESADGAPPIVPDISSSEIRNLLKNDPNSVKLEKFMPIDVLSYIKYHSLYM